MRVNTNMNAMIAHNQMNKNTALSGNAMEKISSGLRITKAGDDAAGLAISEKMRAQIRGMEQASRNTQDGVSLVQTAEGAMEETGNILQRMRELAVQGANDTNIDKDREKIQAELDQLTEEIDRIGTTTKFNGTDLLKTGTLTLQVGANAGEIIAIDLVQIDTNALTVNAIDVSTAGAASTAISDIDNAIEALNKNRATFGAYQNRLETTVSNLTTASENLTAAESRIRDVDVAKEMINLSKLNILSQAAQAMVGQAKQQPEGVLQLLR